MDDDRDPGEMRAESVVNALLVEYQNIHQRVLDQLNLYESTNTKILALIGMLYFFGLTNFNTESPPFPLIVNLVFIVVIPFIAIASVAFAAANLMKIMIWGDFLKIVENKVNTVLRREAKFYKFGRNQVLSWEYWRVEYGYAGKFSFLPAVTFSGFLVLSFVIASAVSLWLRLRFIVYSDAISYPFYRSLAIFIHGPSYFYLYQLYRLWP
jgi:hypothetical protein